MMINEFLNYLKFERNRSDLTIKNYGEDLRAFEEFYGNLEG
ncbi:MAG: site-specific integrase, partial [Prevotella salivae]